MRLMLLLALVGCSPCESPPRVANGTETQQALATEAVTRFYAAMGDTDVLCLEPVRFEPREDDGLGSYLRGRIRIRSTIPDGLIMETVTHELCHAADESLALVDIAPSRWPCDPSDENPRCQSENFAYTCEAGPLFTQLVGDSCPNDTDGSDLFADVLALYSQPALGLAPSGSSELVDVIGTPTKLPADGAFAIRPTLDGGLRISLQSGQKTDVFYVNLADGRRQPASPLAQESPEPLSQNGERYVSWAEAGDSELWVVRVKAYNGGQATRLVHRGPQGARRVDCRRDGELVFASEGELWSIWAEPGELRWGRWRFED